MEGGFKATQPGPSHKAEHSPYIVEQDSMLTHSRVSSGELKERNRDCLTVAMYESGHEMSTLVISKHRH